MDRARARAVVGSLHVPLNKQLILFFFTNLSDTLQHMTINITIEDNGCFVWWGEAGCEDFGLRGIDFHTNLRCNTLELIDSKLDVSKCFAKYRNVICVV
ncbi:Hypothetical predicted protein [Octopus vulgaris]|uniref:Uncharacterized protein n=1 Tax=Octopus vulgaris TaxID=6645 RepID=A0AA36AET4_OCTVU|nr:Hypothetical predicted protein [Octopus vulgaris]